MPGGGESRRDSLKAGSGSNSVPSRSCSDTFSARNSTNSPRNATTVIPPASPQIPARTTKPGNSHTFPRGVDSLPQAPETYLHANKSFNNSAESLSSISSSSSLSRLPHKQDLNSSSGVYSTATDLTSSRQSLANSSGDRPIPPRRSGPQNALKPTRSGHLQGVAAPGQSRHLESSSIFAQAPPLSPESERSASLSVNTSQASNIVSSSPKHVSPSRVNYLATSPERPAAQLPTMQPQRPNRLLAGDGHRQQIPPRSANLPDRKDMDLFFGERRHTASSQDLYTGAGVFQAAMTNTPGGAVGGAGLNENLAGSLRNMSIDSPKRPGTLSRPNSGPNRPTKMGLRIDFSKQRPGGLNLSTGTQPNKPQNLTVKPFQKGHRRINSAPEHKVDLDKLKQRTDDMKRDAGTIEIPGYAKTSAVKSDFENLGLLGQGTQGKVFRMLYKPLSLELAVKQMQTSGNLQEQKRILQDNDVYAKSRNCENIVRWYGVLVEGDDIWIVMEHAVFGDFKRVLEKSRNLTNSLDQQGKWPKVPGTSLPTPSIPEFVVGEFSCSLVNALNYLKSQHKIIHRDIRPSNVVVNEQGLVKLCDFGLAGNLQDSVAITQAAGVETYMAPERIKASDLAEHAGYDVRSDVYALGVTIHELASGKHYLSTCRNPFEVATKVVQKTLQPVIPAEQRKCWTPEFHDFLAQATSYTLNERPKYDRLLAHPFIKRYEGYGRQNTQKVCIWLHKINGKAPPKSSQVSTSQVQPFHTSTSAPAGGAPVPCQPQHHQSRGPPQQSYSSNSSRLSESLSKVHSSKIASSSFHSGDGSRPVLQQKSSPALDTRRTGSFMAPSINIQTPTIPPRATKSLEKAADRISTGSFTAAHGSTTSLSSSSGYPQHPDGSSNANKNNSLGRNSTPPLTHSGSNTSIVSSKSNWTTFD